MLLSPSVTPLIHAILLVPNAALTNAMACKVFRDVRFGNTKEAVTPKWNIPSFSPASSAPSTAPAVRVEKEVFQLGNYPASVEVDFQPDMLGSEVPITRQVRRIFRYDLPVYPM